MPLNLTTDSTQIDPLVQQRLASLELAAPRLADYDVIELIGEGSYGTVWKAREKSTGVTVSIKRLRRQLDSISRDDVEKLAQLGAARGIVALRNVHLDEEPYCYVMEYLPGGTLAGALRNGPLPPNEAWRIFKQLAEALAYVHKETIIHCDLKPTNILLDSCGNPRIADFGQARRAGPSGYSLGTPFYMPPEQVREIQHDPRWDVYALGAIFYELLTGQKPRFDESISNRLSTPTTTGSEARRHLEDYARHLEDAPKPNAHRSIKTLNAAKADLVDRCLAIQYEDRPEDATEVLTRIARCDQHDIHHRVSRPLLVFGGLAPATMLLLLGIAITIAGTISLGQLEQYWDELIKHNSPIIAKSVGEEIKQKFDGKAAIVLEEAQRDSLRQKMRVDRPPNATDFGDQTLIDIFERNRGKVYRWSIADEQGYLISNYGLVDEARKGKPDVDPKSANLNFAWRGWFNGNKDRAQKLDAPRQLDLDEFHRRELTGTFVTEPFTRVGEFPIPVVAISCPIYADPNADQPIGVLSGLMLRESFFDEIEAISDKLVQGNVTIVIVNQQRQVLFHSNEEAWLNKAWPAPGVFHVPEFKGHDPYQDAFGDAPGKELNCTPNFDPIDEMHYLTVPYIIELKGGQKLAVFVQQRNEISPLWSGAVGLAISLLFMGVVFLAMNTYALRWTLRRQREAALDG
jgi:hypothetical protein